jgi:uncharacterized protein (TIGR02145 family)
MMNKYFKSVLLILLILIISCDDKSTSPDKENKAPNASFAVYPTSGDTSTNFYFDASGSSDNEDPITGLQVRWDWESDGNWDTDYSITKIDSHQYTSEGTKTIVLEVKDSGGLIDTATAQVYITGADTGTVTDFDGNVYKTIKLGNQWWMAENLRVAHYANGDSIPEVTDFSWGSLTTGACCTYIPDSLIVYGRLYNWYAVADNRGIAPAGWHVPTDEEWKKLEMFLGMSQGDADFTGWRGTDEGGKLKENGLVHWMTPNTGATNESGFTALPGGERMDSGLFGLITRHGFWWSSTEFDAEHAWFRLLRHDESKVYRANGYHKRYGYSVRCIKD